MILFRIQHFQKRGRWIAVEIIAELIHFVEDKNGIAGFGFLEILNNTAGHSADISLAVPTDFRFVAKTAEIHMSMMASGVSHMHAVEEVELPAGKAVALKPGGYHVMLMGVTAPVKAGEKVPIVITVEDKRGKRSDVEVQADVRALGK